MKRFVAVVGYALTLSACASSCDKADGGATSDAASPASDAAAPQTSRCTGPTAQRTLAQVTVVGQAVVSGHDVAIGVLLDVDGGRTPHQGVVLTDDTLSQHSIVDLGEGIADAPAPKPFVGNGEIWVASHPRAGAGADGGTPRGRVLRVQKARASSGDDAIELPRGPSATLAFDVAWAKGSVVAAWEEDVERRGVIRVARAGKGAIAVSPLTTDADDPKLLALADGRVVVAWTGRREELVDAGREHELERPSEERAFRWAEVAFVDPDKLDPALVKPLEDGGAPKPLFSPYRATAENGHVVAVELGLVGGAPVAYVQDEGAEADGAGGRVLGLMLGPAQARDLRVLVARGVGHSVFDYLPVPGDPSEGAAYLSFADVAEHQMLGSIRLGQPSQTPDAPPTAEPTLDLGRPLLVLGGAGRAGEQRVLALKVPGATAVTGAQAFPSPELWVLGCAR